MRKLLFCLFMFMGLLNTAHAGFVVKRPVTTEPAIAAPAVSAGETHEHLGFFERLKNKMLLKLATVDQRYGGGGGEGSRALFWGLVGLFIWPLGILAIVHGVRGLNSRNGLQQDRALLGLILGVGEVVACIVILALIFSGGFFIVV